MHIKTNALPESVCDQTGLPVVDLFRFIGNHAGNTTKQRTGAVGRRDEVSQRAAVEPRASSLSGRPNVTAGKARQQRENRNIQPLRHAKTRSQKAANRTIFGSMRGASRIRRLAWCSYHHDASTHLSRSGAISRRSRIEPGARACSHAGKEQRDHGDIGPSKTACAGHWMWRSTRISVVRGLSMRHRTLPSSDALR